MGVIFLILVIICFVINPILGIGVLLLDIALTIGFPALMVIRSENEPDKYFKKMTNEQYELYVIKYISSNFKKCVVKTPERDKAVSHDYVVSDGIERVCVQCRKNLRIVGRKQIDDIIAACRYHDCTLAVFFSSSSFTLKAKKEAKQNGVILVKNFYPKAKTLSFKSNMSGYEYEQYVAQRFKLRGYVSAKVTRRNGDFGADIILTDNNHNQVCVQCKKYSKPVGIQAVQEVISAKAYYGCNQAFVVTTSSFTPAARELARKAGVVLYEKFYSDDNPDWIDRIEEFNAMDE